MRCARCGSEDIVVYMTVLATVKFPVDGEQIDYASGEFMHGVEEIAFPDDPYPEVHCQSCLGTDDEIGLRVEVGDLEDRVIPVNKS